METQYMIVRNFIAKKCSTFFRIHWKNFA